MRERNVQRATLMAGAVALVALGVLLSDYSEVAPAWASGIIAIATLLAAVGALWTARIEARALADDTRQHTEALIQERRLRTLEFVGLQMNTDEVRRARRWLQTMERSDEARRTAVQELDEQTKSDWKELRLACNRIGTGVRVEALSLATVRALFGNDDDAIRGSWLYHARETLRVWKHETGIHNTALNFEWLVDEALKLAE